MSTGIRHLLRCFPALPSCLSDTVLGTAHRFGYVGENTKSLLMFVSLQEGREKEVLAGRNSRRYVGPHSHLNLSFGTPMRLYSCSMS